MSENKIKGFVFYYGFYEALNSELLDDATFRHLVTSICEFVFEDKEFSPQTEIERMLWNLIRPQLKANKDRFHNGTKGGRKRTIDREKVTELHTKGYTQGYIAEQLGCSRKSVNSILSEASKGVTVTKPKKKNKKEKNKKEKEKELHVTKVTDVTPLDEVLKEEMRNKLR